MMKRSLMVPGSLSSALHTTYLIGSRSLRTMSHLMPVGNPAPPIPLSPLALSFAITPSQSRVATKLPQRAIMLGARVGIRRQRPDLFITGGMSGSSLPPSAVSTSASACAVVTLR